VTKKQKQKDTRLRRTYNVTLQERQRRSKKQHDRCSICNVKCNAKGEVKDLHIDHWHAIANVKIKLVRLRKKFWKAYNVTFTKYGYHLPEATYSFKSSNKRKAKKYVRQKLKKMANRGLVCWPCNAAIRAYRDNPVFMRRAAEYLERYFKKLKVGDYDFGHA
jgi:hypothetical protein